MPWESLVLLSVLNILLGPLGAKDVQVLHDVQCCMQYSKGSVRLKDVLYFEMQVDGPDCSIPALIHKTQREGRPGRDSQRHQRHGILLLLLGT
ncbi:chemokine (C-C motif) ligand 44 isoform X2 [Polypterus senegalus]|uniref:chemokine (C-C motif) ligand 44 isoform X2 n=1 Tax=Polypterus senegalus TaxID=55291 RepID=UPI001962625F|nr:chemokine (C-C motif) ligand 44 isoform X2 [Polypterus senegalus]